MAAADISRLSSILASSNTPQIALNVRTCYSRIQKGCETTARGGSSSHKELHSLLNPSLSEPISNPISALLQHRNVRQLPWKLEPTREKEKEDEEEEIAETKLIDLMLRMKRTWLCGVSECTKIVVQRDWQKIETGACGRCCQVTAALRRCFNSLKGWPEMLIECCMCSILWRIFFSWGSHFRQILSNFLFFCYFGSCNKGFGDSIGDLGWVPNKISMKFG